MHRHGWRKRLAGPVIVLSWMAIIAVVLTACADSRSDSPVMVATSTLIPSTSTPSPEPPPPTAVPATRLPRPDELPTYTPVVPAFLPAGASLAIQNAISDLRRLAALDAAHIVDVLNLREVHWPDGRLGCSNTVISTARKTSSGIAGYRIVLGVADQGLVYHADAEGVVIWCRGEPLLSDAGTPLIFDPVADSLVELARADLAQRMAKDPLAIYLLDLAAVTWLESSLGCPRSDLNYTVKTVPGYRLVFKVADEIHLYHADGLQVTYCPAEREVLPPPYSPTNEASSTRTPPGDAD